MKKNLFALILATSLFLSVSVNSAEAGFFNLRFIIDFFFFSPESEPLSPPSPPPTLSGYTSGSSSYGNSSGYSSGSGTSGGASGYSTRGSYLSDGSAGYSVGSPTSTSGGSSGYSGGSNFGSNNPPATDRLVASCRGAVSNNGKFEVLWSAQVSGGRGPYQFSWSLYNTYTGQPSSRSQAFNLQYPTSGRKDAAVRIVDSNGIAISANCTATIPS